MPIWKPCRNKRSAARPPTAPATATWAGVTASSSARCASGRLPLGSGTQSWHAHFHSLVGLRRSTEVFDPARRRFVSRKQAPAYDLRTLSSSEVPAVEFARLVRQHRRIENGLHHVLDSAMADDASRVRRNPGVFACLAQARLNLLSACRLKAPWSPGRFSTRRGRLCLVPLEETAL